MAIVHKRRVRTTPPRTTPPIMAPLRPPPLLEAVAAGLVEFDEFDECDRLDGLTPIGHKLPPLGGSTQNRELPSLILTKFEEIDIDDVVLVSIMNLPGLGTVSVVEQFGPRAPINDVLPKKLFLCTVKLTAEVIAIP